MSYQTDYQNGYQNGYGTFNPDMQQNGYHQLPSSPIPVSPTPLTAQSTKLSDGTIQHSADTISKLKKLLIRLKANQLINAKANEYYTLCNNKMVYPAIFISAVSSIASFMSTSSEINDNMKSAFGISVGIITTISTMMQAISAAAGHGTKAAAFLDAADAYSKLITNVQFEIDMPDENKLEFFNKIEEAILKINEKRKILPPLFIATPIMDKYHNDITKMESMASNNNSVSGSSTNLSFGGGEVSMMRKISSGIKNIFSSSSSQNQQNQHRNNNNNTNSTDLLTVATKKERELVDKISNVEEQNKHLRLRLEQIHMDMDHLYRENKLYKDMSDRSNNMISDVSISNKVMTDSLVAIISKNILSDNTKNVYPAELHEKQHPNSPVSTPVSVRALTPIQSPEILNHNRSVDQVEINIPELEMAMNEIDENEKKIIDNTLTTSSI